MASKPIFCYIFVSSDCSRNELLAASDEDSVGRDGAGGRRLPGVAPGSGKKRL